MNLFISYSRDDNEWTYKFWHSLLVETDHHVWLDQRIVPASNWWHSILTEIEKCDVFVYIMSPKSVESIYCLAEMHYAVSLDKPVLPLMLTSCKMPDVLRSKQVQFQDVTNGPSLERVLLKVEQGLRHVERTLVRHEPPTKTAARPPEPKPTIDATETLQIAEDAVVKSNYSLAESLLLKVIENDKGILGETAKERLEEIRLERECVEEYRKIKALADNPTTLKTAQKAWKRFIARFGTGYDPDDLKSRRLGQAPIVEIPPPVSPQPKPVHPEPLQDYKSLAGLIRGVHTLLLQDHPKLKDISALGLLPPPFEWIEIPAGQVTLERHRRANRDYIVQAKTFILAAFAIAKYPITNAQFAKFIEAGGYTNPKWWTDDGWKVREKEGWTEPRYWQESPWNTPDHPVVGVSWYEAMAFCLWLSEATGDKILLPTDQHWQRAAQGDDGRAYPWGGEWDGSRCNNSVQPHNSNSTTPVTHYEGQDKGDSPFGVVDMSGNVWEWCLTAYETGQNDLGGTGVRLRRGGSWDDINTGNFRVDFRGRYNPDSWYVFGGFRVCHF